MSGRIYTTGVGISLSPQIFGRGIPLGVSGSIGLIHQGQTTRFYFSVGYSVGVSALPIDFSLDAIILQDGRSIEDLRNWGVKYTLSGGVLNGVVINSDGEIVGAVVGLRSNIEYSRDESFTVISGQVFRGSDGTWHEAPADPRGGALLDYHFPRCFLPGTPILMADGTHKPIEQIRIGDLVMAFDPADTLGRGALTPSRVTRTFQNTTRTVVDLRGLRMTPGHVCLTGEGGFATIAAILATDGTLVLADGAPIRARTGARLGSAEDALVRVLYADPATGAPAHVMLRAGIPCAADGLTLAAVLAESGYTTLADGGVRVPDGEVYDCVDWPVGTTPLDAPEQRNWIVLGPDGQPYTPDWMQGLEEEAGLEQAVGATTRTLSPGTRPAFRPQLIGGTLSGLPAIGSTIGRMR